MHSLELSFGATAEPCQRYLEVDPVGLVRGKRGQQDERNAYQYVNDRTYVLSSFLCNDWA